MKLIRLSLLTLAATSIAFGCGTEDEPVALGELPFVVPLGKEDNFYSASSQ